MYGAQIRQQQHPDHFFVGVEDGDFSQVSLIRFPMHQKNFINDNVKTTTKLEVGFVTFLLVMLNP